jgi:hypothetical protein
MRGMNCGNGYADRESRNRALTGLRLKDAQWVEPRLTARVRHLAGAKYLRHAVVKALE